MKKGQSPIASESFVSAVVFQTENRLEQKIDKLAKKMDERFNAAMEHLVDIAGKFNKFDEEQVVLSHRVRKHTDQIEALQKSAFKHP